MIEGGETGQPNNVSLIKSDSQNRSPNFLGVTPQEQHSEEQLRREMLIKIGQRCVELTNNPQTDISPSQLFEWRYKPNGGLDKQANDMQLANPQLPPGVEITRAVRQNTPGFGHTNFIFVELQGNMAVVQLNENRTNANTGIFTTEQIPERYREVSVVSLRRSEISQRGITLGKKYIYHYDRLIMGETPETTRIESVEFTDDKQYKFIRENFPELFEPFTSHPVTHAQYKQGVKRAVVVPTSQDLSAILRVLEMGEIDTQTMKKTIAYQSRGGKFITDEDYAERIRARDKLLAKEAQTPSEIIVDASPPLEQTEIEE